MLFTDVLWTKILLLHYLQNVTKIKGHSTQHLLVIQTILKVAAKII